MRSKESARDFVVANLRDAIIRGELSPGEHVVEQLIAERLGVSRSPVREALAVLQRLGLVRHALHRGMFVAELDLDQYREIYVIRGELEGLACSLAARHGTDEEIGELERVNSAMAQFIGDVDAFLEFNTRFHALIHTMSRSPMLAQLIQDLWQKSSAFRRAGLFADEAAERSVQDHTLMVTAIRERDPELARMLGRRAVHRRWPGLREENISADGTGVPGV